MRILVASVTNNPPELLAPHLLHLREQEVPDEIELSSFYITDNVPYESAELLDEAGVRMKEAEPKPDDATYAVSAETHHWSKPTFYWLARQKQFLIDVAKNERFDAIWLVDSDLVVGSDTLASLLSCNRSVVSAVFWTHWTPDAPPLPQVWMEHPYELQGRGYEAHEFIRSLRERELIQVGGLGACTLIRSDVFGKVGFWPLIDGLPDWGMWQGEDRHFCVRAERNHIALWADAWPDIFHIYRPSDLDRLPSFQRPTSRPPKVGDLVSFTIEPVEEPARAGYKEHVRGRLGALRILPNIERALQEMKPGDERFIKARFPSWWKVPEYRGKTKALHLRLIAVKDGAPLPPTLADFESSTDFLLDAYSA